MNPTTATRTRRNGWWATLTLAAVLAGVAACGQSTSDRADAGTSSAPTNSAPAPLPSQDWNRLACTTLPHGALELLEKVAETRKAAEYAVKSTDPLMHQYGATLLDAVDARDRADFAGDQSAAVDANLDMSEASLKVAEACSALYGDGNW